MVEVSRGEDRRCSSVGSAHDRRSSICTWVCFEEVGVNVSSEVYGEGPADGSDALLVLLDVGFGCRSEEGDAGVSLTGGWWGSVARPSGAYDPETGGWVVAFLAVG